MAKPTQKERIAELEEELAFALESVAAIEAHCAHVAVEWREIGGIRVGLGAAGNAVRMEGLDGLYGWFAEPWSS
jgi:hypothetical protein